MNCDGIARWYRALEYLAFGRALERRRFAYLDLLNDARRVLILGDGDGRFTAEFVKSNRAATVDSVELSGRMVELAKARLRGFGENVTFRIGDARSLALDGTYDLVVTHFFLDCFTDAEVEALIERVAAHCEPGARWIVSEFALPESGFARAASRLLIRFMYFCFRITTGLKVNRLSNYRQALIGRQFALVQRHTAIGGLLVSELWRADATRSVGQP